MDQEDQNPEQSRGYFEQDLPPIAEILERIFHNPRVPENIKDQLRNAAFSILNFERGQS